VEAVAAGKATEIDHHPFSNRVCLRRRHPRHRRLHLRGGQETWAMMMMIMMLDVVAAPSSVSVVVVVVVVAAADSAVAQPVRSPPPGNKYVGSGRHISVSHKS
jgi:hypothetical protein